MADSNFSQEELSFIFNITRRRRRKHRKKFWIHQMYNRRREQGAYHNLLQEISVGPSLVRRDYSSSLRPTISPAKRLALTLRFLATCVSQMSLSFSFRISPANVSRIVYETCEAIWFEIQPEYLAAPTMLLMANILTSRHHPMQVQLTTIIRGFILLFSWQFVTLST
uniref:Nuclease HARBI1 n=1 Tax=Amphimedon queenslandica TaxID=400682 RepID=A0A1X7TWM6_AMPQE